MLGVWAGHSLGGALATLAAYDVRALGKSYNCTTPVTCITFGAPRTGNHAFARDLEEMVPDCWHIINGTCTNTATTNKQLRSQKA